MSIVLSWNIGVALHARDDPKLRLLCQITKAEVLTMMRNFALGLVVVSAMAFVMAVVMNLGDAAGLSFRVEAEGFSRASNNLVLIAIALMLFDQYGRGRHN